MKTSTYYTYKKEEFICKECKWKGLGENTDQGELFNELFEIYCPSCHEVVGIIPYPTIEEVLEFGDEEEKEEARLAIDFHKKIEAAELKSIKQLPEINGDQLIFEITEKNQEEDDYVVISLNGKVIWEEIIAYEYYSRFLELGALFKKKYGSKMIDFIPNVDGYLLWGDKISAPKKIEDFRNSLKS
jgi:uncharacterized protein (DUF169 family)